jgi:hypothetical protein
MKVKISALAPPKIQTKGGKSRIMRPEDALVHLRAALAAVPGSRERQLHLEAALTVYYLGSVFKARDDRRGRPRGDGIDDGATLLLMDQLRKATGETEPRKLAKLVIAFGCVPLNCAPESAIRRLTRRYRRERRL